MTTCMAIWQVQDPWHQHGEDGGGGLEARLRRTIMRTMRYADNGRGYYVCAERSNVYDREKHVYEVLRG